MVDATSTPTPTPTTIPPTNTPTPTPTSTVVPPTPTPSSTSERYYYQGLICGGSIVGTFYSDTNLGDNPGVIYAYSAAAGGTNQCFDNITRIYEVNTNPILAIYGGCNECNGVVNYVAEVYNTNCEWIRTEVVSSGGISAYPLTLTMFYIATAPIEGNVVMKLTSSTYDTAVAFPTINNPYYNTCAEAWAGFNG